MKTVIVLDGQTLIDIAEQELGDPERTMEIAVLNGLSPTACLVSGSKLFVPDYDPSKRTLVKMFSQPYNKPASCFCDDKGNKGGIGYWYIENDFIVQ